MDERGEYEFTNYTFVDDVFDDLLWTTGSLAAVHVNAARTVERQLREHMDAGCARSTAIYMMLALNALSSDVRSAFDPKYARDKALANHASWYYDELLLESNI